MHANNCLLLHFSTTACAIPEESRQTRRWDADFHAFVCRVVAVRIILTDDMFDTLQMLAVDILEMPTATSLS